MSGNKPTIDTESKDSEHEIVSSVTPSDIPITSIWLCDYCHSPFKRGEHIKFERNITQGGIVRDQLVHQSCIDKVKNKTLVITDRPEFLKSGYERALEENPHLHKKLRALEQSYKELSFAHDKTVAELSATGRGDPSFAEQYIAKQAAIIQDNREQLRRASVLYEVHAKEMETSRVASKMVTESLRKQVDEMDKANLELVQKLVESGRYVRDLELDLKYHKERAQQAPEMPD